ncbi:hypothetical protein BDK51DRAFT_38285 [Blyttiomyces helicus]|uniref:Uncharacterized protein n=1 Tax=Blyttiomyces helicus TaxID=388810 RepID=A0A4V1IQL1_9FUNG|nr:hypothetical protein BDK51DRAFT_38285 [Blyttiomyces helicus]|eukprot:RKO86937.1 hypothetical protein BDK51DRAFT_38285 [Blyttiomyces helicus]
MEIVTANPEKPWAYDYLTRNPNITLDIVKENPLIPNGTMPFKILLMRLLVMFLPRRNISDSPMQRRELPLEPHSDIPLSVTRAPVHLARGSCGIPKRDRVGRNGLLQSVDFRAERWPPTITGPADRDETGRRGVHELPTIARALSLTMPAHTTFASAARFFLGFLSFRFPASSPVMQLIRSPVLSYLGGVAHLFYSPWFVVLPYVQRRWLVPAYVATTDEWKTSYRVFCALINRRHSSPPPVNKPLRKGANYTLKYTLVAPSSLVHYKPLFHSIVDAALATLQEDFFGERTARLFRHSMDERAEPATPREGALMRAPIEVPFPIELAVLPEEYAFGKTTTAMSRTIMINARVRFTLGEDGEVMGGAGGDAAFPKNFHALTQNAQKQFCSVMIVTVLHQAMHLLIMRSNGEALSPCTHDLGSREAGDWIEAQAFGGKLVVRAERSVSDLADPRKSAWNTNFWLKVKALEVRSIVARGSVTCATDNRASSFHPCAPQTSFTRLMTTSPSSIMPVLEHCGVEHDGLTRFRINVPYSPGHHSFGANRAGAQSLPPSKPDSVPPPILSRLGPSVTAVPLLPLATANTPKPSSLATVATPPPYRPKPAPPSMSTMRCSTIQDPRQCPTPTLHRTDSAIDVRRRRDAMKRRTSRTGMILGCRTASDLTLARAEARESFAALLCLQERERRTKKTMTSKQNKRTLRGANRSQANQRLLNARGQLEREPKASSVRLVFSASDFGLATPMLDLAIFGLWASYTLVASLALIMPDVRPNEI